MSELFDNARSVESQFDEENRRRYRSSIYAKSNTTIRNFSISA